MRLNNYDFADDFLNDVMHSKDQNANDNLKKIPASPHVLCKIENIDTCALIDSGSQISAISEDFYHKLKKSKNLNVMPVSNVTVSTAIGKKSTNIRWQIFLEIEIGYHKISHIF